MNSNIALIILIEKTTGVFFLFDLNNFKVRDFVAKVIASRVQRYKKEKNLSDYCFLLFIHTQSPLTVYCNVLSESTTLRLSSILCIFFPLKSIICDSPSSLCKWFLLQSLICRQRLSLNLNLNVTRIFIFFTSQPSPLRYSTSKNRKSELNLNFSSIHCVSRLQTIFVSSLLRFSSYTFWALFLLKLAASKIKWHKSIWEKTTHSQRGIK